MPAQIILYTLREANFILPEIASALRALKVSRRQAFKLEARMAVLELIRGEGVNENDDEDGEDYRTSVRALEFLHGSRRKAVRRIRKHGVRVRSVKDGYVDFFALRGREVVVLCWKLGEKKVHCWHRPDEPCGRRRPISSAEDDDWH